MQTMRLVCPIKKERFAPATLLDRELFFTSFLFACIHHYPYIMDRFFACNVTNKDGLILTKINKLQRLSDPLSAVMSIRSLMGR